MQDYDVQKREDLLRGIRAQWVLAVRDAKDPLPVVSLEAFFEGNDDYGSIGCNLLESEHPGPPGF
jgi:hypothetical protein